MACSHDFQRVFGSTFTMMSGKCLSDERLIARIKFYSATNFVEQRTFNVTHFRGTLSFHGPLFTVHQ
jgi:hypothetical protein